MDEQLVINKLLSLIDEKENIFVDNDIKYALGEIRGLWEEYQLTSRDSLDLDSSYKVCLELAASLVGLVKLFGDNQDKKLIKYLKSKSNDRPKKVVKTKGTWNDWSFE
jgi:hypothetical protein